MDLYKELLDASKPFQFVELSEPSFGKRVKKNTYHNNIQRKLNFNQHEYVEKVNQLETEKLQGMCSDPQWQLLSVPYDGPVNGLLDVECASSISESEPTHNLTSKYNFSRASPNLPIGAQEKEIVQLVEENQAVVIQGPTGCGKTTQVPQYILDHCFQANKTVNIVVTQPRRIAAYSVAKRVCDERNWPLGSVVGYKVGLKSSISADTRVTFCTTGVLLQHLITKKNLNDFTHIIVDEVHERDQEMDFLLLVVRKMLRSVSPHVKVILMSATFNCDKFSKYFCYPSTDEILNAPVIKIGSKTKYLVDVFHLEEIQNMLQEHNSFFPADSIAMYTPEMCQLVVALVKHLDTIEEAQLGSVLVFLPGLHEIEDTYEELVKLREAEGRSWKILPLHSAITREEQMSVFSAVPEGQRKIILSTNISESSITVPDVKYVIDSCLAKQLFTNTDTNISCLAMNWASKVNCLQRKGRIGRVSPGTVYRLVPKEFYESFLEEQPPEMQRCPLSKLVLMAKVLDIGAPKDLLGLALDPPKLHNIESTILNLKEIGGLHITYKGKVSSTDGEITYLGRIMANLPLDIHLAKLIVFGQIFGVYESCLIIAAAMYTRNLLATPFTERLASYLSKLAWSNGSGSDSIALLNAFKNWRHKKNTGFFEQNIYSASEEKWARDFFLQMRPTREILDLIEELDGRLKKLGFIPKKFEHNQKLSRDQELVLLKIVMAGAFYPNYFVSYTKSDDKDAVRALTGYDPYSTIYLTNFPLGQPGEIYTHAVKKLLGKCANEMKVTFDGTSKIYVQFPKEDQITSANMPFEVGIPSRASLAVYKAVKMRMIGEKFVLKVLPKDASEEWKRKNERRMVSPSNVAMTSITNSLPNLGVRDYMVLPLLSTNSMQLKVTHVNTPSKFFIHVQNVQNSMMISRVMNALNGMNADLKPVSGDMVLGKIYVAPSLVSGTHKMYFRAKLTAILPCETCKVLFVDFGNSLVIKNSSLLDLSYSQISSGLHKIPFLALECRLSHVGPIDTSWSVEATSFFKEQVLGKYCTGEVFSVVDSVIHLKLKSTTTYLNDELISMGFACSSAETFLSRENNRIRGIYDELSPSQICTYYENQYSSFNQSAFEEPDPTPPNPLVCTEKVVLKGPYSPLEIKVQHMIKGGKYVPATIEQTSVNSVLLNDDPLGMHERFIVAGNVHTSQSKSHIILRDTNLMPTVPGMLPIVSMLFAPKIELRTKPGSDHYSGMLCGLGCERKTRIPLYPEHDMELVFDTAFSLMDLQNINRLRFWINFALAADPDNLKPCNTPKDIAMYQQQTQSIMFSVLDREREQIQPTHFPDAFKWQKVNRELLLHPGKTCLEKSEAFPLHWGVLPEAEGTKEYKLMKKRFKKLENLSLQTNLPNGYVDCKYCMVTLFSVQELRQHLVGEQHEKVLMKMTQFEKSLTY